MMPELLIILLAKGIILPFKVVSDGIKGTVEVVKGTVETATECYYKVVGISPSEFVKTCCSGDVSAVEAAMRYGVDVKNPSYGGAALIELARNGNLEVVDLLIRYGADANARVVDYGKTWMPLLNAIWCDNFQMVSKLIGGGADVNVKLENGNTPLLWLAMRVSNNIKKNIAKMISLLLKNGADVNAANERGETALIIVSKLAEPRFDTRWSILFKRSYETGLLSILIENGADVNAKDAEGNTALMYVSKNARLEGGVPFLLEHGADPSIKNNSSQSARDFIVKNPVLSNTDECSLFW
jgi:ankyrin repeat protein